MADTFYWAFIIIIIINTIYCVSGFVLSILQTLPDIPPQYPYGVDAGVSTVYRWSN